MLPQRKKNDEYHSVQLTTSQAPAAPSCFRYYSWRELCLVQAGDCLNDVLRSHLADLIEEPCNDCYQRDEMRESWEAEAEHGWIRITPRLCMPLPFYHSGREDSIYLVNVGELMEGGDSSVANVCLSDLFFRSNKFSYKTTKLWEGHGVI